MLRTLAGSLALASSLSVCGALPALAQDELPEIAWVSIAPCEAIDREALLLRLRTELRSDGVGDVRPLEPDASPPEGGAQVAVIRIDASPCAADATTFVIRIDDLVTLKRVERSVDLATAAANARPRTLALAAAELLRASWAELALAAAEEEIVQSAPAEVLRSIRVRVAGMRAALGDPSAPAGDAPVPARRRAPALALSAAFVVMGLPAARSAPIGGRIALDIPVLRELVLRFDIGAGGSSSLDPLGAIDVGLATLGATAALEVPIGELALISIGPRASAGVAWAIGHAYDPRTTRSADGSGPLIMAGGALELDLELAPSWSLRFGASVEAVAVAFEARVRGVPVTGVSGGALAAWVGIAAAP